jgi:hypothetical protein
MATAHRMIRPTNMAPKTRSILAKGNSAGETITAREFPPVGTKGMISAHKISFSFLLTTLMPKSIIS